MSLQFDDSKEISRKTVYLEATQYRGKRQDDLVGSLYDRLVLRYMKFKDVRSVIINPSTGQPIEGIEVLGPKRKSVRERKHKL